MSMNPPIFTQKHLKHLIRSLKEQQQAVFCYTHGGDFFQEVMASLGPSPVFLVEEIVAKTIKAVIDEDSRVDLDQQPDFFEYGEKLIKLPEGQAVKVAAARIEHMRVQQQTLLDNHIKQIRGFLRHHDQIVTPIIRTMEEFNLRTAGEALQILQAQSAA